jgi:GT2 family glycosyltransferase
MPATAPSTFPCAFGVVVIARNEGERLRQCLAALPMAQRIVYVDSGSTDGSVPWARARGVDVVELDMAKPFTAARARNAGLARLRELSPQLQYVQFVDGDCELAPQWPAHAVNFLDANPRAGAAFGRLRERHPERSIYNRLCDDEWNVPIGEARSCGGNAMMRVAALTAAGGFRDDMIAGEEPELCVRLRAAGWSIWRIEGEMGWHHAAMSRFGQWWLRQVRSGYAFAHGAKLHGAAPERLWVRESGRALIWGLLLPLMCALSVVVFGLPGLAALLIYPLQLLRRSWKLPGPLPQRWRGAAFEMLARLAEAVGVLKFWRDRLTGTPGRVIEYK